jgi:hypothetical protein
VRAESSIVYVIGASRGPKKIGVAANPDDRLRELAYMLPGQKARVAALYERPGDARFVEWVAQRLVAGKAVHGREWFKVSEEEAIRAVEAAISLVEARDRSFCPMYKMPRLVRLHFDSNSTSPMRFHHG